MIVISVNINSFTNKDANDVNISLIIKEFNDFCLIRKQLKISYFKYLINMIIIKQYFTNIVTLIINKLFKYLNNKIYLILNFRITYQYI